MTMCPNCKNYMDLILEGEVSLAGWWNRVEWCSGCGSLHEYRTNGYKNKRWSTKMPDIAKQSKPEGEVTHA